MLAHSKKFDQDETRNVEKGTSRQERYQRGKGACKHVFALLADLEPSRYEMELKVFQGALEASAIHLLDGEPEGVCATEALAANQPPAATRSIWARIYAAKRLSKHTANHTKRCDIFIQINRQRGSLKVVQRVKNLQFNVSKALLLSVAATSADTVARKRKRVHQRKEPLQPDHDHQLYDRAIPPPNIGSHLMLLLHLECHS